MRSGVRRVAATTVMVVASACGATKSTGDATNAPAITSADSVTAAPAASAASCVEVYTPATLATRSFAFDGTVLSVRDEVDPRLPAEEGPVPRAEFKVHDWFREPDGPAVIAVWMQRQVEVDERLLVSGEPRWGGAPLDDAIAWECGFTEPFSDALAREWTAAIG